ncbi:hypothetical protein NEOLI_003094 [Neolecta irregularis DAH-3]|uniref:Uncharacterized protein n=1 Tax=Neolecta irregularis (strain DAH-3) TaxID=1198029 RepID=A0A1U7LWW2_NEOID|nr:hypothetical protein NEOLI_003094 [Neolecta irregularis DAH-3]|eukprot:OLL27109.1 hypothetical protein NEOLI_003094 [Neolecta irregularis DAH-3]
MNKPFTGDLSLPQISNKDLLGFHQSHFGQAAQTVFADYLAGQQLDPLMDDTEFLDAEVDAVYYPDGVRRTLTDEQIEMFRWSEEQAIIRRNIKEAEAKANNDNNTIKTMASSIEKSPSIPGTRSQEYRDRQRLLYGADAKKISQLEDQIDVNYQRTMERSKFKYWPSIGLRI